MIAAVVTGFIIIYGLLHVLLHYTQDASEPPIAPTLVPFFGHMIGLSRKGSKYHVELRDKFKFPIHTIRMPGARLYIVNSTSLIPAVQKQYKTLAFAPVVAKFSKNITGSSKAANKVLDTNPYGDDGPHSYLMTFFQATHSPLQPGQSLDGMNRVMAQTVAAAFDLLKEEKVVKLFDFISHEITIATTDSVYGPQNPFRDPKVEQHFWGFLPGIMVILLELVPSLLAKESLAARKFVGEAFIRYFKENGHLKGSGLVQARYNHSMEYKIAVEDIARYEVGGSIAILTNTSPATFWMVYHIYSNPKILEECRQELANVVADVPTTISGRTVNIRTLDMSRVKFSCPLLLSTFQEVLRTRTVGISTRQVMEDHILDGKYLLKKGGTVMIPGPVQHTDTNSWGSNVESFDHRRFLPKNKTHNPVAFRGFGGGTTLCPGRHFASTEILAFTALLILRCDVMPVSGKWVSPTTKNAQMWEVTPRPDKDIEVKITPRAGADMDVKWKILVTDSDKGMQLSAEDM